MGYNVKIGDGGGRMKKALPVGVDNFGKIISGGYYYVDKTIFIKGKRISRICTVRWRMGTQKGCGIS